MTQTTDMAVYERATKRHDRIIWTLAAIGSRIGVGPDFVRDTLAKQNGSPVKEIGGRYYAFEEDLMAFLRRGSASGPVTD